MATAIKKTLASNSVSFFVNQYTRDVVERCPSVDRVIAIKGDEGILKLASIMRRAKVDALFIPAPKIHLALAAFIAGISIRVGTAYRWYSFLFNRRIKAHRREGKHHEAEYNLRMLAEIDIEPDLDAIPSLQLRSDDHIHVDDFLIQNFGKTSAKYAVLHIPSRGSSIDWSHERFVELAKAIEGEYHFNLILTGTEGDRILLESIQKKLPKATLFIGYQLSELAALLSRARIVIANATGPVHLSAALGAPTVGLFPLPKAIAKERWGLRGNFVKSIAPLPIQGCPNCNNCSCMERIMVADVMQNVHELISEKTTIS